jgi:hypothetical protein
MKAVMLYFVNFLPSKKYSGLFARVPPQQNYE